MTQAGDAKFGGVTLKDADASLIKELNDQTLPDHWAIQASSVAYYGQLKNKIARQMEKAERDIKLERLRFKAEALKAAKETYMLSRPSKEDIDLIMILEDLGKINELEETLAYWKAASEDIDVWLDAWKQKSFSMRGYTDVNVVMRYNSSEGNVKPSPIVRRAMRED